MSRSSPLKAGLAMFIGAAILFFYWLTHREATILLVMAIAATLWGILWVVLQRQANVTTRRESEAPSYEKPGKGKWVALSRVRSGLRQGWLVADCEQLFLYQGRLEAKPGESLILPTDMFTPIVTLDNIERFRHIAGLWSSGTLEIYNQAGRRFKFQLKDPEGLPLLMDILKSE